MGISWDTWSENPQLPPAPGPETSCLLLPKPELLPRRPAKLCTLKGGNENNPTDEETEARGAILFKPENARALSSSGRESKVPGFNLSHCDHGVPISCETAVELGEKCSRAGFLVSPRKTRGRPAAGSPAAAPGLPALPGWAPAPSASPTSPSRSRSPSRARCAAWRSETHRRPW